ncbi:hypothetical protein [Nocardia takedensis]|uniref:hypothetical protein n=1 Tax=Nocardia takedensis TaxID=259390 RepID=UPI0002E0A6A5|nr:hypothetical protein [Nocardia takedensis]
MPRNAIGLLHLGYPDQLLAAQTTIEDLAQRYDYTIRDYAWLDFDTFMPAAYIIATAAQAEAVVILAANLDHFGTAYKAVPRACPVRLPTGLIPGPDALAYHTQHLR